MDQFSLGMMCTLKCESLPKYLGNLSKQSNMKIPVSGYAVQNWYISTTPQVETNELNMISFLLWYHSNIFFVLPENFLTLYLKAISRKLNRKLPWYILFAFCVSVFFFFFQAEDGIRDYKVTGVQTCALPIWQAFYSVISSRHHPSDPVWPEAESSCGLSESVSTAAVSAVERVFCRPDRKSVV